MKILFCYSRDIDINDSGGARTTIELMNSLSEDDNFEIYTSFIIINGGSCNIHQNIIPFNYALTDFIRKNQIDLIMIPEGQGLIRSIKPLTYNTQVKIVTAFHSMPGYEKINLHLLLLESIFYNDSIFKRIRALISLSLYPIFKKLYVNRIKRNFALAYKYSDYFVLLSDSYRKDFIREYNIKDNGKKLLAIPNAISFHYFADSNVIKNKKKQILVVSRFNEQSKRLSRILKVWKNICKVLPDWELIFVGFGRSEKYYKRLIIKHKLERINLMGKQAPLEFYKDASIFLMASDYEGWGMTIVEAMQCGCVPIVLDTFKALYDIIEDNKTGFICKDMITFEKKIIELSKNDELRMQMAYLGVESTKRFLSEVIHAKYKSLFQSLVN